ncbi:MAG: hypothetical protein M3461_05920 [Pseudomonadota bacterium]|nr:hypothetical protein [Pseudomonadota bacterium]
MPQFTIILSDTLTLILQETKNLFFHILPVAFNTALKEAWRGLNKSAVSGIDRVMARDYEQEPDANIEDLVERLKGKRYRARAVRRHYIQKVGGKQRLEFADQLLCRDIRNPYGDVGEQIARFLQHSNYDPFRSGCFRKRSGGFRLIEQIAYAGVGAHLRIRLDGGQVVAIHLAHGIPQQWSE